MTWNDRLTLIIKPIPGHRRDCSVKASAGHRGYPTQLLHSPQCRDKILAEPESMTHWCRTHEHAALPPVSPVWTPKSRETHACITAHTSADRIRADDIVWTQISVWWRELHSSAHVLNCWINSSLCVWWASHVMMMMLVMVKESHERGASFIYAQCASSTVYIRNVRCCCCCCWSPQKILVIYSRIRFLNTFYTVTL